MAQKILNGVHISGSTQIDFMPTHESEGIITLGRYDANTSRYHNIKSYVSSTQSSNYLKFSLHNGTANTVVDVLTLDGSKNATFAGALDVNGTSPNTFAGNIIIENAGPIIQAISTNNASGLRLNVVGIGNNTNHLLRVQSGGTTIFDIRGNTNATFAGAITTNANNTFKSAAGSGQGIELNLIGTNTSGFGGSHVVRSRIKTITDDSTNAYASKLEFYTNDASNNLDLALKLDSSQNATFAGDLTIPQYLKHASDADTYFGFSASNQVLFHVGGGDRLIINSAGNVGIGNTSPSDKLDVSGNIRISSDASNNADAGSLLFLEGPGQTWGTNAYGFRIQHNGSSNILNFESSNITTNQTIFTLTRDTARVGIGTTSPETKMHIKLAGGSGQLTLERTGSGAGKTVLAGAADGLIVYDDGFSPKMYVGTSGSYEGNVGIGTIVPGVLLDIFGDGEEWLRIVGGASNISGIRLGSSSNSRQNVLYRNRSNDLLTIRAGIDDSDIQIIAGGDANEIMRFDGSNSRVGIGTTSPAGLLHLSSGTSGDAVVIIESDTDNNDENDNPQLQFKQDGGNTIAKIGLSGDAGTIFTNSLANTAYFGNDEAASVQLYTNATARLTIESGGDVGIGTTNPDQTLDVFSSDAAIAKFTRDLTTDVSLAVSADNSGAILSTLGVHNFRVFTNSAERMRINSSGVLLVNRTSAYQNSTKFSMDGMAEFETTLTNNDDWQNSPISIGERGNVGSGQTANKYAPNLNFHWGGITSKSLWMGADGHLSFGEYLSDGTPTASGTFLVNTIGIGTSGPTAPLHIVGNTDNNTNFIIIQDNDPSANSHRPSIRFRSDTAQIGQIVGLDGGIRFSVGTTEDSLLDIRSGGNIGIGTTNPQERLHVYKAGASRIETETTTGPAVFKATNNSGSYGWYVPGGSDSFKLYNFSTDVDLLTFSSNGNATFAGTVTANGTTLTGATDISGKVSKSGDTMSGNLLVNAQLAVNSTTINAANKLEVHGQARVSGTMMIGDSSISNATNTGQLHIKNTGEAIIRLEDSDNSNLAFDVKVNEGEGFVITETIGGQSGGNNDRLVIAESTGDATFSGNLSAKKLTSTDGILELDDNGTHNGIINVPASLRINIDSDNNNTGESFQVANNATNIDSNNILFKIEESGAATFAGNADFRGGGSGYNAIRLVNNTTADNNKQTGITTLNYAGNNVSIMQYATNSTGNTVYYGSADGAHRGLSNHRFYVNADVDTASSGHTQALHIASNTNATFAGKIKTTSTATGAIEIAGGTGVSTTGAFILRQNGDGSGNGMAITSSYSTSHRIWKDASGNLNIGSSGNVDAFKQDITGNVTIEGAVNMASGKITSDGSAAAGAYLELKHANNNSTDVCATINLTNNAGGYAAIEGGTSGANNTGYINFKTDNAGTQGSVLQLNGDKSADFFGNVDIYTGTSLATLNIGRNANEKLQIDQTDNETVLTAYNDSDSDGTHNFRLNRVFQGSGANNFKIQKGGTDQFTIDTNANATFAGNVTVSGNLTINGTQTILNTQTVEVEDNILLLNKTGTTATAATSGISIYRGSSSTAGFIFDDGDDTWDLSHNLKVASTLETGSTAFFYGNGAAAIKFGNTSTLVTMSYSGTTGIMRAESGSALEFHTNGVNNALTLDTSQNATFAGVVKADGNVALGNISGVARLQHEGSGQLKMLSSGDSHIATFTSTGTTFASNINLGNAKSIKWGNSNQQILGNNTNGLSLYSNGERMRILTNGNVGIGTTAPVSKLHVVDGDIRVTTSNSFSNLISSRAANPNAGGYNLGGLLFQAYAGMTNYTTGAAIYAYADGAAWTSNSVPSYLSFHTATSGSATTTEKMVIKNNGYVGIGTTSPSRALHINSGDGNQLFLENGTSSGEAKILFKANTNRNAGPFIRSTQRGNSASDTDLRLGDENGDIMTLNGGRVGIGIASPVNPLHVKNSDGSGSNTLSAIKLENGLGNAEFGALSNYARVRANGNEVIAASYGASYFYNDNSPTLTLTSNKVGIGNTNPLNKLTVRGPSSTATGSANNIAQFEGPSGTNGFQIYVNDTLNNTGIQTKNSDSFIINPHGGNVGIATTSPTYKLSVAGAISGSGFVTYTKNYSSLNSTGNAVAGITADANGNGSSCGFTFTCFGGTGKYQKVVYACYNGAGTWYAKKVIDEGTNDLDVVASANGSTITFTFKATSSTQYYTPRVKVEAEGHNINSTYA